MTNLNHRILALFIPFVMMAGDGNWKLTKEKNNITTFIGPGNETGLKPTRSVMNVPLTTEETLSAILDFDRYKDWVPYCEESKLVDNQGDTLYHFFQMLDMPLIKNRDMYIRVEVNRFSKNEVGIRMIGAPTYRSENEQCVRIELFKADYQLSFNEAERTTSIEMRNEVDPGGFIPTFALNWASRSQPFETFSNLKAHMDNYRSN